MKQRAVITSILAGAILLGGCAAKNKNEAGAAGEVTAPPGQQRAAELPEAVPAYVNEVKAGAGRLDYTATEDGRLYVVDTNDNVVLFSGTISKGQAFALDPEARRATLDGKYVFTREINPNHSHKLYFTAE